MDTIDKVTIKVINKSGNDLPEFSTPGAAGMDVRAYLPEGPVCLRTGQRL